MGNLMYGTGPDNYPHEIATDLKGNILTAQSAVSVTPNDNTDLANGATKGLYIGGAGNVAVNMQDGSQVILTALAVGVFHNISVTRVKATSTTATNIIALY